MQTFKEYILSDVIVESPMRSGQYFPDVLDNHIENSIQAEKLLSSLHTKSTIQLDNQLYTIVSDNRDGSIIDYFINNEAKFIQYYCVYTIKNGCMYMSGVWQYRLCGGLARILFFKYYLPKFKCIISDNIQSTQGENYWKQIIKQANTDNFKISVLDGSTEIPFDSNMLYWGSSNDFSRYRIKVYSRDSI